MPALRGVGQILQDNGHGAAVRDQRLPWLYGASFAASSRHRLPHVSNGDPGNGDGYGTDPLGDEKAGDMSRGKCWCHVTKVGTIGLQPGLHLGGEGGLLDVSVAGNTVDGLHDGLDYPFARVFNYSFQAAWDQSFDILQTGQVSLMRSLLRAWWRHLGQSWFRFCLGVASVWFALPLHGCRGFSGKVVTWTVPVGVPFFGTFSSLGWFLDSSQNIIGHCQRIFFPQL